MFVVNKKTDENIYWRCRTRRCQAKCLTNSDMEPLSHASRHNHDSLTNDELQKMKHRQSIKRKVEDCPNQRPTKLICSAIKGKSHIYQFNEVRNLRKAISRKKLSLRPKLPTDLEDTLNTLSSMIDQTYPEGAEMVKVVTKGIVILFTEDGLHKLSSHGVLLGDGTFKVTPRHFHQLFTLHVCLDNGYVIPTVYALLPDKKTSTYKNFVELLINECSKRGRQLNMEQVVLDFEIGMWKALRSFFPNVSIRGYRFHLAHLVEKNSTITTHKHIQGKRKPSW